MSTRTTLLISLSLIALALVLSLAVYNRLPAQVASHWGADDQVNGTMSRFWGAFLMPLISLAMLGLFLLFPAIDPLKANIDQFRGVFNLFILLMIAFLVYVHGLTIAWNLGFTGFQMSSALLPAVGLLFIFVGGLLAKAKRNFFIGIRTPWTLSSDTVWAKTHAVGSKLFIASGLIAFLGAFLGGMTAFFLLMIPLLGSALFLVVYSYVLYRQETHV
jgi:uncharacterized membrane protein